MTTRLFAFDVEISNPMPEGDISACVGDLGISCAATLVRGDDTRLWHGKEEADGSLALRMSVDECRELARYLLDMHGNGYLLVTWNGTGFDLRILAEECQDSDIRRSLASLALQHVDPLFAVFCCKTGYRFSLQAAAEGMGLPGKTPDVRGEDAPRLWRKGREAQNKVLEYVARDVHVTSELYQAILDTKALRWRSRAGQLQLWKPPNGRLPTVSEAMKAPQPDVSWMKDPSSRAESTGWIQEALPDGFMAPSRSVRPDSRQVQQASWTADQVERLVSEFDAGAGVDELARRHGRTPNAIIARLHQHGRTLPGERRIGNR